MPRNPGLSDGIPLGFLEGVRPQCDECAGEIGSPNGAGCGYAIGTMRSGKEPRLEFQAPLEVLDFVVDSKGRKLIPNPAHGGEQMTEEY
ncbi:MAG: hypothetical protein ACREUU_00185 [Gammaproteobacteria bacterium]